MPSTPRKSKKTTQAKTISPEASSVLAECSFFTALGLERQAATETPKRPFALDPDARSYWLKKHLKTIPAALKNPKNKWATDRQFVLPQAEQLGTIAMTNAMNDPINKGTPGIKVTKAHVKAASQTIAHGPVCVAARTGRLGSGPYCPEP
jgi:hypothetical protein